MAPTPPIKPPRCPRCGRHLAPDRSQGLCLPCLAGVAFGAELSASPDLPVSLGTLRYFGDYELIEEIARGGMGVVYRARQKNLGREVAIKLLLHGALASEQDVDRFRAEAAAAASLKHRGIVSIHEVGECEGQHYFSMDLIAGRDLAVITRDGPLPARRAAEVVAEVGDAVQHAHDHGVLHRDLKPSNILMDAEGQPHVTDFGLARRFEDAASLTQTGSLLGTPGYMAPEQAAGKSSRIDARSDVYGLGAVLYHVLTGRAPFTGESATDILGQVVEREPIAPTLLNRSVPRDLETICLKCLSKEPGRRYSDAKAVAEDLGRFLRHEPILARPIGSLGRLTRWARRKPVVASLGAAVLLLLLGGAIGSILFVHRLQQARRSEAAQRVRAEDRQREGEQLINFMLGDLADRLEPVGRLDVLESTISQVDQFYAKMPSNLMTPESRHSQAKALYQFADIRAAQGRLAESVTNYDRAIQQYTRLLAAYSTNLEWQFELTRTWNDLGISYARQADYTNAFGALNQSLNQRERLIQIQPTNTWWLGAYGVTACNLGQVCRHLNRLDQAGDYLHKAEKVFRQWMATEPSSSLAKSRLATTLGALGHLASERRQFDEADRAYVSNLQLARDALRTDPKSGDRLSDVMLALDFVGETQTLKSNYVAAVATLAESVNLGDQLLERDAANKEWQMFLTTILVDQGAAFRGARRPQEALASFRRAWTLCEEQADAVRQSPHWTSGWRDALEAGEPLEREFSAQAAVSGKIEEARQHKSAADKLKKEIQSLPPDN
jgi:tetratricopeptide (TPR) repeat protein/tRNA A-37 threonylcarbamoyl transferase component Bud32